MDMPFYVFATYLEKHYGVQFDREEGFVICPECGELLYSCDWSIEEYTRAIDDEPYLICPICDSYLDAE